MDILLVQCLAMDPLMDTRFQGENLGIAYLLAVLRDAGYSAGALDAHLAEMGPLATVEAIMAEQPWMVGFSSSAQEAVQSTFDVIARLRQAGYKGHITIGGHFPTYEHEALIRNVPGVDSVVRGEGEATVVELADRVRRGESLDGVLSVTYRRPDGTIQVNPPRPLIGDLDSIPHPHRDTLPMLLVKNRRISILASRGCYGRCTFCSVQTFYHYRPRRVRSVENVVSEMSALYAQGVRKFRFVDDLFMDSSPRSKAWVKELCRKVKEAGMSGLNVWLQVRAANVDLEVFQELVGLGLQKVFLGLESGHAETLERYAKSITAEQSLKAIRTLEQAKVPEIAIGMMIFEPDVTLEGIRDNVEFLKKLGHFHLGNVTSRYIPYSGTPLTERLLREGRVIRKTWTEPGTYHFTDPRVEQLFPIVKNYQDLSQGNLKLTYDLDILLRAIEKPFVQPGGPPPAPRLHEEYRQLRRDIEDFSRHHGDLMAGLVDGTISAVQIGLDPSDEPKWYDKARQILAEAVPPSNELFTRAQRLLTQVTAPEQVRS